MTIDKKNKQNVSKRDTSGIVTTLLKPHEREYLDEMCKETGCSPSEALRALARLGMRKLCDGGRVDEQKLVILYFGNVRNAVDFEAISRRKGKVRVLPG